MTSTLHLRLLLPWHVPISTHTWRECRSEDQQATRTGGVEVKLLAIKERLVRAKCIHQFLAHKERSSRRCLICDLHGTDTYNLIALLLRPLRHVFMPSILRPLETL